MGGWVDLPYAAAALARCAFDAGQSEPLSAVGKMRPIPEGAMRVAPGSDAVVWKVSPEHCGEL